MKLSFKGPPPNGTTNLRSRLTLGARPEFRRLSIVTNMAEESPEPQMDGVLTKPAN